jgi:hypothetical protein
MTARMKTKTVTLIILDWLIIPVMWALIWLAFAAVVAAMLLSSGCASRPLPASRATPVVLGKYGVLLSWNPCLEPSAAGYRVYYGTASRSYSNTVTVVGRNVTTNIVDGLASGVTHFFAVTAYNAAGNESPFSTEVSVSQAHPTVQLGRNASKSVITVWGLLGHKYQVQATQDFKTWTTLGTVTVGNTGSATFTNTTTLTRRFYRTQEVL